MRSLFITGAVVTAAIALCGCPYKKPQEPLPGPKVSIARGLSLGGSMHEQPRRGGSDEQEHPAEIRWFQGSLDEAFTRRPCIEDRPQLRY